MSENRISMGLTMKHAVLITNTGFSMVRHRGEQIRRLVARGWKVSAIALYENGEADQVRRLGAEPYNLSCAGASINIPKNLRYLINLTRLLSRLRPDVVHSFSFKAGVWGCLAARATRVRRIVCTITGSGYLVIGSSALLKKVLMALIWFAFHGRTTVIFQNESDLELFVERGIVKHSQCRYIPGCGVDVDALTPNFQRARATFVMVARMLWNKGVVPFCEAAHILKEKYPEAEFLLVGGSKDDYGPQNDDFVPVPKLKELTSDGRVKWIGLMPPAAAEKIMADATAVVLLSTYGEGVPRVLIEAAALGAPIITTDMPGCRDVVLDGISGFLCNGDASRQAADAMMALIDRPRYVAEMGEAGRKIARKFDASRVMAATMEVFEDAEAMRDEILQVGQRAA